ncbi:hypothetical protein EMIHUDRAFT_227941 [Emiliania huxleyi CCMP1516]|uniref:Major facilitator superfamily (MFS) profile domain-containing protein n=2 Tax=Emiliania huxleyi TaxID=2903 RepID=A0A0D3KGP9_EMIH1|nr:hypothetical protein EMIHUDRAFT_227941 [Emiliania huxleyi CCMP1516]EOD34934.1 hypothetical protein EMIHUDRAFT_227941 [Emiliania huxleyi CCMP1516]|eukprot:XP_005787363.1 hypothetical protein EMIHUDRAFT_227941 [Emiliania huxleyi CCMP1516]
MQTSCLSAAERDAAAAANALQGARKRAERYGRRRLLTASSPAEPALPPAESSSSPRRLYSPRDRALLIIYTTVAIDMLGSALTVPVMPFLVEALGGDASSLGLLFSTFAVAQIGAGLWMGAASDRLGRRPILLVSLAGSAVGMLGSAQAPTFRALLGWRFLLGAFSGTSATANAYIADITAPSERPKLMSWIGVIASLCFMFGPGVGTRLSESCVCGAVRAPFYVGAAVGFAALLVALFQLPPAEQSGGLASPPRAAAPPKGARPALARRASSEQQPEATRWRVVVVVGLGSFLSNTASSCLMTCQALLTLRTLAYDWLQRKLGLMRCASFGALLSTAAYTGYSLRLYVVARCIAKGGRLHAAPPPRSALAPADEAALGELQAMLRELLVARGYAIAASRLQLAAALEAAFPGLSPAADPEAVGGRKGVGAFRGEGRDPEGAEEEEEPLEATVHHSAAHHHHTCVHERERA